MYNTSQHAVLSGCDLCDNEPCFKRGTHIPIPPLPPVAIIKKCERTNHHKCFSKSLESNEWYAHSVEELVIWVVESEKGIVVCVLITLCIALSQ